MKKKTLSNKEKRQLNEAVERYGFQFDKKENVELVEDSRRLIKSNNEVKFFYSDGDVFPSLKLVLNDIIKLRKITVDMGAVKFVVNGADVMRPGVVKIEDGIAKDSACVVVDVNNEKPLAVGKALFSTEEMRNMEEGKVVKNLHYVGDEIWEG